MKTGKIAVKVGCCGFSVARPKYFGALPVVEIQQTFYEPPRPSTAKRWREDAPQDFEFTLKAWQLITHEPSSPTYRRLRTPLSDKEKGEAGSFRWTDLTRRAWQVTLEVARALNADKVLFQCPASFRPIPKNRDRLSNFFNAIEREGIACIWEPRGDWQPDEIADLCQRLGLVHCVDPFQGESVTDGLRYYRLHGIGGYRHEYTEKELRWLSRHCADKGAAYILFNNVSMFQDAFRFQKLLAASGNEGPHAA